MNSSVPMSVLPPGPVVSPPSQSGAPSGGPPGAAVSSPAQSGTSGGGPPGAAVSTPAWSATLSGGPSGTGNSTGPHHQIQQPQVQPNPPLPGNLPIGSAAPPPRTFHQPGQMGHIPPVDPHYTVQGQYLLPRHMSTYLGLGHQSHPVRPAPEPSCYEADKQPWRYRGYPEMSMWMASDDDFFVLRRFGALSARVALMLQDQLTRLEEELEKEDVACMQMPKGDSGTFRNDVRSRRQEILGLALWTLEKYSTQCSSRGVLSAINADLATDSFVLGHSQLKARPHASAHQIENVKNWLSNANGPINEKEAAFIERQGDLFAVVTNAKTPLRRFLEKISFFDAVRCFQVTKVSFAHHCAVLLQLMTTLVSSSTPPKLKQAQPSITGSH